LKSDWGYAHANGFVVLSESLYMFRLRAVATGEKMNPSGNLFFTKRNLVEWVSWRWTQRGWYRFGWRRLRLGGRGSFWL